MGTNEYSDDATVIVANAYVLNNHKGETKAQLTTNDDGEAHLVFMGRLGNVRMALGVTKQDEARIAILDDEGNARATIGFNPAGEAHMALMGVDGKASMVMHVGANGDAGLSSHDGSMNRRIFMGIDQKGFPYLQVLNPGDKIAWTAVKPREGASGVINPATGLPFE